ncbi:MAG: hypothetical protein JXR96_27215 [Deltaproteobacteria bacterium]|nr:hypothetical protein [Deltaproteobacteria bacterium]
MSELYAVSVLSKTETRVDFHVQVVHPDSMHIPSSKTFAMQLLFDPIHDWQIGKDEKRLARAPLAAQMDLNDYLNEAWIRKNASGFIKSVKRSEVTGRPPKAAERDGEHPYWRDASRWMSGKLSVTVHHPAWIQHLEPSLSFETAAYDQGEALPWKGEPLAPGAGEQEPPSASVDPTVGMLRLGLEMFSASYQPEGAPRTVLVPYHGLSKYEVVEKLEGEGLCVRKLKAWMGKPVVYRGSYSEELGTPVKVTRREIRFFHCREGSHGMSGEGWGSLSAVGLLRFKGSKARLVDKPSYDDIYRYPGHRVEVLDKKERQVDLRLSYREPGAVFENRSDALCLLYQAVEELSGGFGDSAMERSPVARLIKAESELTGIWRDEMFSELAGGVIERVAVLAERRGKRPDFDTMTDQAIVDFFENPGWPGKDVRIAVFEPAWILHLKPGMRYNTPLAGLKKELPWKGEPRRASDRLVPVPVDDPMLGFTKRKKPRKDWPAAFALEPDRNDDNYLPWPRYTRKQITDDRLSGLLGEPVVVEWRAGPGERKQTRLSNLVAFDAKKLSLETSYGSEDRLPRESVQGIGRARVCRAVWLAKGQKAPRPAG